MTRGEALLAERDEEIQRPSSWVWAFRLGLVQLPTIYSPYQEVVHAMLQS